MTYHITPVLLKASSLLLFILLFSGSTAKADMPGNIPRTSVTVTINNVKSLGDYVLHIVDDDRDIIVTQDTVYTIGASQGKPHSIMVFASRDTLMTDTMYYDEFQQFNYDVALKGISGRNILYDLKQSPVSKINEVASDSAATDISLINIWKTNEVLIGISFVALVGLIIYFVWRKKKKGPGSIDAAL